MCNELERLQAEERPALVAYANAHALNIASTDPAFHAILNDADLVLNDGSGLALAARLQRQRFPENLNGSDLNPRILELASERGWGVYLLGAGPGVAEEASRKLGERIPGLRVVGTRDGYFDAVESESVAAEIRQAQADVLMVAMGNPLQEKWLSEHLGATGAALGVGVGAFFDFAAARVPRAPAWMNRAGVEWLYRLYQEPRRMWRRYVVGNPLFVLRVLNDIWSTRRGSGQSNVIL